jgi:hypothetical protein
MQRTGKSQNRERECRARALAQAKPEIKNRIGIEFIQNDAVTWFGRAMRKEKPGPA